MRLDSIPSLMAFDLTAGNSDSLELNMDTNMNEIEGVM